MSFHLEDPDLENSTPEIGFPNCAIEKGNFIDSQGKQIRMENKESFPAKGKKQREHLSCSRSHHSGYLKLKVPTA